MSRFARLWTIAAVIAALAVPATALASSHREAPLISEDPSADNTDVYAWVTPGTHDKLYVIANYIPLEEPAGGPNFHKFSDNVRYSVHISRGDDLNEQVLYHVLFSTSKISKVDVADQNAAPGGGKEFFIQLSGQKQTYRVIKRTRNKNGGWKREVLGKDLEVAPLNIGPRSLEFAYGAGTKYDDTFIQQFIHTLSDGSRVFAGPRDDAFYVDLGGVFDLANLRAKGSAQDGVSGFNTHSLALEIPTTLLTADGKAPGNSPGNDTTLGIWASAERRKFTYRKWNGKQGACGPWVQVSRLGFPLINEAVIGLQDKDRYNASHPKRDVKNFGAYFLNPIVVRDAEAVGIYSALGVDPTPFKFNRTDIIDVVSIHDADHSFTQIGDVLRVDMAKDSGFPNGRPLIGGASPNQEQADVTDVILTVVLAKGALTISDGVDYNDKNMLSSFPYLPHPHEGRSEGHGKTTP